MSTRHGRLQEGRWNAERVVKVVNELYDRQPRPGVVYFPAVADIPAFHCAGLDQATGGVTVARADGDVQASGVVPVAAALLTTATVVTNGRINGAVSGRAPNDVVYVGLDGSLVFAPPGGYSQVIAVCINATDIYVTVGVPVF